ncbi:hypothetical protein [Prevotella sp. OH937_COT-195]|uniref:hypothetical protein n=1 Tax=Prevotella sp. OH937_COT-195 TaxID=2491051 RepID=UPI000F64C0C4|nr:hypothetical protein [Prevotella sp. OH937_COT-195]RRD02442.1 hypothetical protein EII32_03285 [Prevotella sp. OH937_COT-195]
MPYRRLPKTDSARLKALKTLLENDNIYTVQNRFIDWKTLNRAQPAYDKLLTACQQYKVRMAAQTRNSPKMDNLMHNATMYVSHFIQVLLMSVERGEIKRSSLSLYGMDECRTALPPLKAAEAVISWGDKIVNGEKIRVKNGGRPIYNPTIGMVSTHLDIFRERYNSQKALQGHSAKALENIRKLRPEVDDILLELWNQIEKHFENEPAEVRFAECRKYGVVYYYRRHEEHLY